jgi:hypothetical protein
MPDHQTSFAIPFHENSMKTAIPTCIHFYDKLIVLNVEAAAGGLYILKCFIISSSSMIQNTSIEIFSNSIVPHFHFLLLSETISPHLLSPPSNQEDTLLCPTRPFIIALIYASYFVRWEERESGLLWLLDLSRQGIIMMRKGDSVGSCEEKSK